ncbi:MAG: class I poly(R)-hydroxyalkanoic acid synthase [Betaproteobacteria bacterium]|nr:class I poly(R)-hydroxyalkanoic acid synthase [Betaproteobacteria bacterium]
MFYNWPLLFLSRENAVNSNNPETPVQIPDPVEMARNFSDIASRSSQILTDFVTRQGKTGQFSMGDELGIAQAFMDMAARLMADPFKLAQAHVNLWTDYMSLWQTTTMKMLGHTPEPVAEPAKGDKRFKHEAWEDHFLFDYSKQSYLIAARHLHGAVAGVEGLDEQTQKKVNFYTRQYIDALSPTNFVLTNPEVFNETVKSGGQNLVKGLSNLLEDLERGNGQVRIKMTDPGAFKLGENIATTPGKVVFQTELAQLLQYEPTTADVHRRPLLILPPWINKFYIMDLREKNSFIKWAVDQGHTVFVLSWVNPDEKHAQKDFEDYLLEGPIAALDAIEKATGEREVNAVGYCLGGTLLASALGYMAAKKDSRIASATFFTTMIDFSEAGELEVFVDEQTVSALEKRMESRGFLEGHEMAGTFNMLRANDLIWSFVVNNYLLGKDPFPFDLLHWNSDSTRMPARMHSFYLRNMYIRNLLREPGAITLAGAPIDLGKVKTPSYFLSTVEDHIAPWKSTYAGARLFSGPVKFVLGGSGHIAGVINPPAARKYGYWASARLAETADAWFESAGQHEGSWWSDWDKWVAKYAGEKVSARVPGKGKLKVLENAPGSYVKQRTDEKKPG